MATNPFVLRWGIVGAGGISGKFAADLALNPVGREVNDVDHAIAVVGSRDVKKAQAFIDEYAPNGGHAQTVGFYPHKVRPAGSYVEVYNDPEVDIVYIGTPHPQHFECAKAAMEAGKGVLLEKPATLNGNEAKILIDLALRQKVFFMEAVWTRFFPLAFKFQELLHKEKAIGNIHQVIVDFGINFWDIESVESRLFNPDLAGGAQLDIGPYTLIWSLLALYEHPDNARERPSAITATSLPDPRTGVDLFTTIVLDYKKLTARSISIGQFMVSGSPESAIKVLGTEGELVIPGSVAPCRPEKMILRKYTGEKPFKHAHNYEEKVFEYSIQGTGLHWEADAVARCVRDGQLTSERCSPEDTLVFMSITDEWRKQTGYTYPAGLEKA